MLFRSYKLLHLGHLGKLFLGADVGSFEAFLGSDLGAGNGRMTQVECPGATMRGGIVGSFR